MIYKKKMMIRSSSWQKKKREREENSTAGHCRLHERYERTGGEREKKREGFG